MSQFLFRTPEGWQTYELSNFGSDEARLLTDIYNSIYNLSISNAKPTIKTAELIIIEDTADSVVLDAYAGKLPLAILGKKVSDNLFEVINADHTAGFTITAANYNDQVFLQGASLGITTAVAYFQIQQPLTGVGSSVAWDAGIYSQVVIYYVDGSTTLTTSSMIQFTTAAGIDTYTDSGLSSIGAIAFVKYGQSFLAADQYSITGNSITIAPGLPVEADLQLLIVPLT